MSLHKSLKQKHALRRRRNVLSRSERLQRMKEEERWDGERMSVFGLPKVKVRVVTAPTARRKEQKAAEEAAEAVEAPEADSEDGKAAE